LEKPALLIVGRSTIHSIELPMRSVPWGGVIAKATDLRVVRFSIDRCLLPSAAMKTEIDIKSPGAIARFVTLISELGYHSIHA
jgi:hypothetical protein